MTAGKLLYTSILLLLLTVSDAAAAQKGLIILEDLSHSLDLSYDYGGQYVSGGGRSASSSQNRFQEYYNFDINYAIYNPRIWKGRLTAKLRADQEFVSSGAGGSSTSANAGFLYNIYGIFLERGYTPVRLSAASEFSHVSSSFSPGYDVSVDSFDIGTSIRNKVVPVFFNYTRFTSETSGLPEDRVQTNGQFSITSSHSIPSISQTVLGIYRIDSKSEPKGDGGGDLTVDIHRSFELALKNSLSSRDTKYNLISGLRLRDDLNRNKNSTFDWQESFMWKLGKALSMGLGYSYATSSQTDNVATTSRSSNSGNFWLAHQLFLNFATRLELIARQSELENGTESEYSGNLGFNYTKSLPRDGRLTLTYNEFRTITDRALSSGVAFAIDEPMTVTLLGGNRLRQPEVLIDTIEVRDASPLIRIAPYVRGVDYDVVQVGAFTELIFFGPLITDGKSLLISYSHLSNPSIKYQTNSHRLGSSLALAGGYSFYSSFESSDQQLLSGNANLIQLNSSLGYKIGFAIDKGLFSYGAENSYLDSTLDKHTTFEGFVRKTYYFPKSRLLYQVRDRFTSYGKTSVNPRDHSENSLSATANYTTPAFSHAVAVVTAAFTDTRGGTIVRDDAELSAHLQWGYGKLFVKLAGKLNWRLLAGMMSLDESLNIELKRYF